MYSYIFRRDLYTNMKNDHFESSVHIWELSSISTLKSQLKSNKSWGYFCLTKWKMNIFLSRSVKLTLEVFLGYSYDLAYFHPDILIEAILIKKACTLYYFFPEKAFQSCQETLLNELFK